MLFCGRHLGNVESSSVELWLSYGGDSLHFVAHDLRGGPEQIIFGPKSRNSGLKGEGDPAS